jgi:hypothetical protein
MQRKVREVVVELPIQIGEIPSVIEEATEREAVAKTMTVTVAATMAAEAAVAVTMAVTDLVTAAAGSIGPTYRHDQGHERE